MRTARHTMLDPLALLSGVTPAEDTDVVEASHPTEPAPSGADPATNQRLALAEADQVDVVEQAGPGRR